MNDQSSMKLNRFRTFTLRSVVALLGIVGSVLFSDDRGRSDEPAKSQGDVGLRLDALGDPLPAGWDHTIRIWDVKTGRQIRKIDAHKAMVGRVVFSPDGRILASRGGLDGAVCLWDPITGTMLHKFVGLSNINPWRFNHDLALSI